MCTGEHDLTGTLGVFMTHVNTEGPKLKTAPAPSVVHECVNYETSVVSEMPVPVPLPGVLLRGCLLHVHWEWPRVQLEVPLQVP